VTTKLDTAWMQTHALAAGFDACGIVRAEKFPELARTEEWLAKGYAGEMKYLSDPRRTDPQSAMPQIRSVIVCALNYNTAFPKSVDTRDAVNAAEARGWISRYAWGSDYHDVLREKLEQLCAALRGACDESFEARIYADTGPIQERVFAKYAGVGWLGKNTLLLNQKLGSLFFLGVILTTLELEPTLANAEAAPPDLCGSCRKCLDACPTNAFPEPYVLNASRCIAYLTIELRGSIPEDFREAMGNHVFGCDICQDVCPWNRRAPQTASPEFQPRSFPPVKIDDTESQTALPRAPKLNDDAGNTEGAIDSLLHPRLEWLASMDESEYQRVFRGSPVKRAKWRGMVRNACIALGNSRPAPGTLSDRRIRELLERLSASTDPVIAESAHWALSRIQ
jgi:epoxyqueuosine reductase